MRTWRPASSTSSRTKSRGARRRHAWVTLHVPGPARLGDPANLREIREIRRRYPHVVLVIAHLGRCYTKGHARAGLLPLADDPASTSTPRRSSTRPRTAWPWTHRARAAALRHRQPGLLHAGPAAVPRRAVTSTAPTTTSISTPSGSRRDRGRLHAVHVRGPAGHEAGVPRAGDRAAADRGHLPRQCGRPHRLHPGPQAGAR